MFKNFSFYYRNPGHWDITTHENRIFRIRGEPDNVILIDERDDISRTDPLIFDSLTTCMNYITNILMSEN